MKKKILLLLLLPSVALAIEEIPLVTITPPDANTTYKNSSLLNTSSSLQTISSDQIQSSGAKSLAEVLNATNSIQIFKPSGAGRTIISMRGFGDNATSNTLILLNGQPYFNPDIAAPTLNIIQPQDIAQIEITPGSEGVLYGDQAVGGMINIITKTPKDKSSVSIATGSFQTYRTSFSLSKFKKEYDFGCQLGGAIFTTNNYRDHNAERINNFNLSLNYKKAYLRYFKINQHLELPGKLTKEEVIQNSRKAENSTAFNNQDHDIVQLGLKHNLSPNWLTNIDFDTKLMRGFGAYAFGSFDEERKTLSLRPKISGIINFKNYSILPIVGMDLNYGKYKLDSIIDYNDIQKQSALFTELTIPFARTFSATLGVRFSKAFYKLSKGTERTPTNEAFTTKAGLKWQPKENLTLFIRCAESYRFPKVDEITYTFNNKLLKTQTGISYETGVKYKNRFIYSSLGAYQIDLKNEILAIPISGPFPVNTNLDPTRRRGLIIDLDLKPIKHLQLKTNYNFVEPKFTRGPLKNKDIPFVARNNLRLSAILKPHKNLNFLVEGIYTGSRYQANDVENSAEKIGGFTIYNLGISYKKRPFTFTLRGNNLTNKLHYNYVVIYGTSGYYPDNGINVLGALGIEL